MVDLDTEAKVWLDRNMSHNTEPQAHTDYFITLIQDGHAWSQFLVIGATDPKDAEEVALKKFPTNVTTGGDWTDVKVETTDRVSPHTLVRCFRVYKGAI